MEGQTDWKVSRKGFVSLKRFSCQVNLFLILSVWTSRAIWQDSYKPSKSVPIHYEQRYLAPCITWKSKLNWSLQEEEQWRKVWVMWGGGQLCCFSGNLSLLPLTQLLPADTAELLSSCLFDICSGSASHKKLSSAGANWASNASELPLFVLQRADSWVSGFRLSIVQPSSC